MSDYKENIIKSLSVMRDSAKSDGHIFKFRAYEKVINNIILIKTPIISYDDIKDIEGAGKNIKEKIKEIIETGRLKVADDISKNLETDIKSILLNIYGIGPKKCKDLINIHKIKSIEDLREKSKNNNKLLTDAQKIGLMCYEDLLERIPRLEMLEHKKILNLSKNEGEIVGSFRRCKESSGDIDVMLNMSSDDFKKYIENLNVKKYLIYILALGDTKMLGICKLKNGYYRRLDIIRNDPDQYPYMIMYFTGSKEFNVAFRNHCLAIGLSLNEHSFTPKPKVCIKTEEDIFKYTGVEYVSPEKRIDKTSIKIIDNKKIEL